MMSSMWEQYEAPKEQPATHEPRDPGLSRPAAGGRGAQGAVVGLVAVVAMIGGGVAIASSNGTSESDYSDFYECVAEEEADDPGLLSPADLCDIGNERPPDYVDDYEYEFDNGFGRSFESDN